MTASRAPAEPDVREFEATVESVDGREVVLDETYFYAESGGQPADRGTIDGVLVAAVTERDGDVVHVLDEDAGTLPEAGETVSAIVDDAFRTYCTRAHTASHVLYGAARRTCEDLGYAGFDISETKVRVDLTTAEPLDDTDLVELERLANRAVWDSLPVSWETLPEDEARALDGIAFNAKTEEGAMSRSEAVRVVTIGDAGGGSNGDDPWDVAACGGTHVANTREIGPVTVLDRSNPGEGMTRVEIAVGPTGIRRRGEEKRALFEAGSAASAPLADLADAIAGLRETNEELESRVEDLQDRLVETQLRGLRDDAVERDGARWIVGAVEGADANALGEHAKEYAGADAGVVALVGTSGRTFVAVAAAEGDAEAVVETVTDEFGGGGGGSAAFAQAGGIDADPEAVVEFVREDLR